MSLTVIYQPGASELAWQMFGYVVDDEVLGRAVGTLDGAEVTFSVLRELEAAGWKC